MICKACGASVIWKQITNDRGKLQWQCFNADSVTIHWDSCSKRRWEQVKATGERFEEKMASGYAGSVHGTKFDMQTRKPIKGKHSKRSGQCRDCVPPWEICPACQDAIGVMA